MQPKIKELTEFSDTSIHILWEDGHESLYLYEDLRNMCPCASCNKQQKSGRQFKKKIPLGTKNGPSIRPLKIENVGHYAIKFYWNDRHDTGIYTFELLRENCGCEECSNKP